MLQPQQQPGGAVPSNPERPGGAIAPPTPPPAKPAELLVGGEYDGKAADDSWWPLTITAINPDGTLEAEVHDGYGSRWSQVSRYNIRGRGGGAPLIQPPAPSVAQPQPQGIPPQGVPSQPLLQPQMQPQPPPLVQQPLQQPPLVQPQAGVPLPPMPLQQPMPMLPSPNGQIQPQMPLQDLQAMQPQMMQAPLQPGMPLDPSQNFMGGFPGMVPQPGISPVHQGPGGFMPQLDPSLMYLQQVQPPPLMSPHAMPPQPMLQSPLPQQLPLLPQTPVAQPMMPQLDPMGQVMAQDPHAVGFMQQQQQYQYEHAMNLQNAQQNAVWAAQQNAWQQRGDQLWVPPPQVSPSPSPTREQLSIDPSLPPGYAPSVLLPPEEEQPPPPDFDPRTPVGARVGGMLPGTTSEEDKRDGAVSAKEANESEAGSKVDVDDTTGASSSTSPPQVEDKDEPKEESPEVAPEEVPATGIDAEAPEKVPEKAPEISGDQGTSADPSVGDHSFARNPPAITCPEDIDAGPECETSPVDGSEKDSPSEAPRIAG